MHLKEDVHKFTSACEHLMAGIKMHRPLTQDEILLVKHYCNEVLSKIDQPRTTS
jgi:hypothetical protein